jgi:hypothetical protein
MGQLLSRAKKGKNGKDMEGPNVEELKKAREEVKALISNKYCNPILVRLAWCVLLALS